MYIVTRFKLGNISVYDSIVYESIEAVRKARDEGKFLHMLAPDCFLADPKSGELIKLEIEFLKENVWKQ